MANFEEFDIGHAFEAESKDFYASELADGTLPSGMRLTEFTTATLEPEISFSLDLVAKVLFHKSNGIEGFTGVALSRAIKDMRDAKRSAELADLSASALIIQSVLQSAQKTREAHIEGRASSLNSLVAKIDAWVSLREPCDTPFEAGRNHGDRTGIIVPVARLTGFDIQRTEDGRPDPVALVEGVDGAHGFYPHRMDLFIGSTLLDRELL